MSDSVSGVVIDLVVSGEGRVSAGADRVAVKLQGLQVAADAAKAAAAGAAKSTTGSLGALESLDTRLEISFQRMRRLNHYLTRVAAYAANRLDNTSPDDPHHGETEARIEAAGSAISEGLHAGRLATQIAGVIPGVNGFAPEIGLAVGAGVAGYELYEKETGVTDRIDARVRRVAREEIEKREKHRRALDDRIDKQRDDYIEAVMKQRAQVAKMSAAFGGNLPLEGQV